MTNNVHFGSNCLLFPLARAHFLKSWNSQKLPLSANNPISTLLDTPQIVMWKKFPTWEMWRKSEMWRNNVYNVWCFVAFYNILLQNQLFCDLRCFVAKSVLVQFTRFCAEKNLVNNFARGEKMTNMRYDLRLPRVEQIYKQNCEISNHLFPLDS